MLRDRCLSCLSATLAYCGETVGWIRIPLERLRFDNRFNKPMIDWLIDWYRDRSWPRGHCVRWGRSSPTERDTAPPHFSTHVYCGQTVAHLSNCWALVGLLFLIFFLFTVKCGGLNWVYISFSANYKYSVSHRIHHSSSMCISHEHVLDPSLENGHCATVPLSYDQLIFLNLNLAARFSQTLRSKQGRAHGNIKGFIPQIAKIRLNN